MGTQAANVMSSASGTTQVAPAGTATSSAWDPWAAVALEGEHGVDHVLQHLGAGNEPLLGHVADEEQAETALLGEADELLRRRTHLRDGAGRGLQAVDVKRLHRIDDHHGGTFRLVQARHRSEEHTSELQSLMRITYAVLCLKNKNQNTTT